MKNYEGWLDIMNLHKLPGTPIHNITEELPPTDEVVIPILFSPGDGPLDGVPLSQWPWEDPLILTGDAVLGCDLQVVSGEGIVLWWISTLEITEAINKTLDPAHIAGFAQQVAIQHLEQKLEAANGNQ
jgi:hypothetical protein